MPDQPSKITRESLATIPLCYATCSLGKSTDSLPARLHAISRAGFAHIEFSFPDLLAHASASKGKDVAEDDFDTLCEVAEKEIKPVLEKEHLKVFILQPFGKFEGRKEGTKEWDAVWNQVGGWIRIMKAIGTTTLQVRSSFAGAAHREGLPRVRTPVLTLFPSHRSDPPTPKTSTSRKTSW